jgi:hypothetical protein
LEAKTQSQIEFDGSAGTPFRQVGSTRLLNWKGLAATILLGRAGKAPRDKRRQSALATATVFFLLFLPISIEAQTSVTTQRYNGIQTTQDIDEAILTPSAVSSGQVGKLFSPAVDGSVFARPLYVPNVAGRSDATTQATSDSADGATVDRTNGSKYGNGFGSGGLVLNGRATINGTRLRLTDGGAGEVASAWYSTPVNIQAFTQDFSFQLTNATADGMAFVIQNAGTQAIGPGGAGLGYGATHPGGKSGIPSSLAVKFDLYNNQGEGRDSTGLYTAGASPTVPALDMTSSGVNLHSGHIFNVHMNYDGTTLSMTITDAVTRQMFSTSWPINIPDAVAGTTAYVGFAAASGGATAIQEVLNWTYAAQAIGYDNGFSSGGLVLNGRATINGTRLRLTNGGVGEVASAWYGTPVNIQGFTQDFSFQLTNATADGMAFVIQNAGTQAIGPGGAGLGYGATHPGGKSGIPSSLAVKFDLYNNQGEGRDSTGLYNAGASPTVPALDMTSSGVNLHSGDVFNVHMNYDGTTLSMTTTDAITHQAFSASWPIDIPNAVAGTTAHVGFTAASGGAGAVQEVLNWTYSPFEIAYSGSAFPIKASANNRYLVDQNNLPWLLMGDSPQAMIGTIDATDMATYMSARQSQSFNAILVDAICTTYTGCNSAGTAFDGTPPFTTGSSPADYDLSTPNPAFFSQLDALINLAAADGLVVVLDPIETGGWLPTLRNNGPTNAFNYGAYLGNRYKNFTNLIWQSGNDFQTWYSSSSDNNLVHQVMLGIASTDTNHLQTIELNYDSSYSNQDTDLSDVLAADAAYTYYGTYDIVLQSYVSSPILPVFLTEANYEGENVTGGLPGPATVYPLREQIYWTMTSGGGGQLWGNHYTWDFIGGWQNNLITPGALQIAGISGFFGSYPWWNLVPDCISNCNTGSNHSVLTGGNGTYNGTTLAIEQDNYCSTGWITDGSLAIVYCPGNTSPPSAYTLTVNMAAFSAPVRARWWDPSNGPTGNTYMTIDGSPFPNSGTQNFTTPGTNGINSAGDPDWVLVLDTN